MAEAVTGYALIALLGATGLAVWGTVACIACVAVVAPFALLGLRWAEAAAWVVCAGATLIWIWVVLGWQFDAVAVPALGFRRRLAPLAILPVFALVAALVAVTVNAHRLRDTRRRTCTKERTRAWPFSSTKAPR